MGIEIWPRMEWEKGMGMGKTTTRTLKCCRSKCKQKTKLFCSICSPGYSFFFFYILSFYFLFKALLIFCVFLCESALSYAAIFFVSLLQLSQLSSILSNIFCNNVTAQRTPLNEMNCEKCAPASFFGSFWLGGLVGGAFLTLFFFIFASVVELVAFELNYISAASSLAVCNFRQMASHIVVQRRRRKKNKWILWPGSKIT